MKKIQMIALAILSSAMISEALWAQGRNDSIAQTGQLAPGGNGTISGIGVFRLNHSGQIAFYADLTGTSGGVADNGGIFRGTGGNLTQIVRRGQTAPDGNGTLVNFGYQYSGSLHVPTFEFNNAGAVSFYSPLAGTSGGSTDNVGIFRGTGGSLTQLVRGGQIAPGGNGTIDDFPEHSLNDSGAVAFSSYIAGSSVANDERIFRGSGGSLTQIARANQSSPDGNGVLASFGNAAINNAGAAAFEAFLNSTSGVFADNTGVFRGSGGSLTQIARRGQLAPDGNGTLSTMGNIVINDSGAVAFNGSVGGTSGGVSDNSGIFRGNGGGLSQIARKGQLAPDGNGTLSSFSNLTSQSINDSGEVLFLSSLIGTSGGVADNQGLYRGSGGNLAQIARRGQLAPNGNGTFDTLSNGTLANSGAVTFRTSLNGTSGGSLDNSGIYVSDGIDLLQVVRKGDSMSGSTITDLSTRFESNDQGQVAYSVTLANGSQAIGRWTPELRWRSPFSSTWDAPGRWTLGLKPAAVHDAYIDPAVNVTVMGPTATTTIRSLHIGGGTGSATLNLNNNSVNLTATNGVTIASNGTLRARGTISGNINNSGTIEVGGGTNVTFNGSMNQNGTLRVLSTGEATVQGAFSGNGFTGGGTVVARTELRPGSSTASVLYDGNLVLAASTDTFIELGGLGLGQFDQLRVTGDLTLAGDLRISLINGFDLSLNQKFLIGDVLGNRVGQFSRLSEGARVGNFGEFDLLISYFGGNGNDIMLFTTPALKGNVPYLTDGDGPSPVPEPSSLMLWGIAVLIGFSRRQRPAR